MVVLTKAQDPTHCAQADRAEAELLLGLNFAKIASSGFYSQEVRRQALTGLSDLINVAVFPPEDALYISQRVEDLRRKLKLLGH
jgi:hypothetical protein